MRSKAGRMGMIFCIACIAALRSLPADAGSSAEALYSEASGCIAAARAHLQQRNAAAAADEYRRAVRKMENILRVFPLWEPEKMAREYGAWRQRRDLLEAAVLSDNAARYFRAGRLSRALSAYNQLCDKYGVEFRDYPALVHARLDIGCILMMQKSYEAALGIFAAMMKEYGGRGYRRELAWVKLHMAACCYALGRVTEARGYARELCDSDRIFRAQSGYICELLPEITGLGKGKAFPVILEFLITGMSDENFLRKVSRMGSGAGDECLAFIALKAQMAGELDKAQEYYRRCLKVCLDRGAVGYRLSVISLERIDELTR